MTTVLHPSTNSTPLPPRPPPFSPHLLPSSFPSIDDREGEEEVKEERNGRDESAGEGGEEPVATALPQICSHGRKTYFCHEKNKNSSWYPSSEEIDQIVQFYESSFLEERKSESDASNSQVTSKIEEQETQTKTASFLEEGDEVMTKERWIVKLHPDCGLPYYTDSLSELSSWMNPFAPGIDNEIFEKITIDSEHKPPQTEEAEKLARCDAVPNPKVFLSDYVLSTKSRLTQWIQREHLRIHDDYAARLNYPEYLTIPTSLAPFEGAFVQISIKLPKAVGVEEDMTSTSRFALGDGVAKVMDYLFKKYSDAYRQPLDIAGTDGYIFKVIGFQEYLLHMDFPLAYYDCVTIASRDKQKLELLVIKLTPAELMDVGPITELSSQYYLEYTQQSRRPDGDRWTDDEQSLHAELTSSSLTRHNDSVMSHISKDSINWPFRVLVQGVSNCPTAIPCDYVQVEVNLYFNGESLLQNPFFTHQVPFSSDPRFPQFWIDTKLEISSLPPTTRISFTLVGFTTNTGEVIPKKQVIAGVCITLVDYRRHLVTGEMVLNMFPDPELQIALDPSKYKHEATPELLNLTGGVPGGNGMPTAGSLHLTFDSYSVPVVAQIPTLNSVKAQYSRQPLTKTPIEKQDQLLLEQILHSDTLKTLSHDDKMLLFKNREYCSQNPRFLSKFLQSVNWASPDRVHEAYHCLVHWAKPSSLDALELLDIRYSDPVVREYALRLIDEFSDSTLQEFLLQLVQVLKYESYHDSPLARLLLRRALRAPLTIGHSFFWMIRSEMHCSNVLERFGTLLVLYLLNCGPHEISLTRQADVNDKIKGIADYVKDVESKEKRLDDARSLLRDLNNDLPPKYCLCLNPKIECCSIKSDKCKVMDSKKLPLWIVFQNADPYGKDFYTIFKSGDDLRQDQITLQLLRLMDVIWRGVDPTMRLPDVEENPLDLKLKPYKCCSTGHDLGMIEVVVDSDTTANIITTYGGKLTGAFSSTPIDIYLREHNQHGLYPTAVDNFVRTCAGYCVATYVLGIGDRHAGNIMVSNSGHLFHIDFGHFLGNFKSKFGIKRERAPFVFTPAMAYIMRDTKIPGVTYQDFERYCCDAYNMLRRRASLFINLFVLMVPAAMPELLAKNDISYLQDMLSLELTIEQADAKFIGEIKNSLNTVSRQIDNWFHTLKH